MAASTPSLSLQLLLTVLIVLTLASVATPTPLRYHERHIHSNSKETKLLSSKNASLHESASCKNVTCKLNFKPEDVDRFRTKIFDDEALAVFLVVTISNSTAVKEKSYANVAEGGKIVPFSLQLKEKWSWIRNTRAKFLATLPYDLDILSLTTLTKDAYNLIVAVNSTPEDCYANLTKGCLKGQIAEGLISMTKETGQVCYKVDSRVDSTGKFYGYKCCHLDENGIAHCDIPLNANLWVQYALKILWDLSFAFGVFSPLLLKYLPKEFQRRGKPKSRQMRRSESLASTSYDSLESSVIVASKILISKGDGFLDIARSRTQSTACSRFGRCLFVILLSLFPILQTLLYVFLKESEVGVSNELLGLGTAVLTLFDPSGKYALLGLYCFCIVLVAIAMAIPKTLSELARRLSGKRDEQSFLGFEKPNELICHSDKRGFQLMYENMIFHLNCLMTLSFWKFAWSVLIHPLHLLCHCNTVEEDGLLDEKKEEYDEEAPLSLCAQIVRGILLLLVFPLWIVFMVSAFILYILPVTYVAFRIWKMLFKMEVECSCCEGIPTSIKILSLPILYILFIAFCVCVEASYFMLVFVISSNLVFLGSVIGFTTMGVLFYIDAYISYVVVVILGLYYIIRAFHELKVAFKRVKVIIFDQCEEHDKDLKTEASIRDTFAGQTPMERSGSTSSLQKLSKSMALVTLSDEKKVPSIPLKLFLSAQNEVFPFKRVVISKILKLLVIYVYLVLVFSFVMSLVEYKAADSLVQAIAILLLGAVPYFMQGNPHEIPEKEEKWIKFHVKEQINKYCKRFA